MFCGLPLAEYLPVKNTFELLPRGYLRSGCHLFSSITAALLPLVKLKIVKKRTKKIIRHQSDQNVKIKRNWQKPRGIDNRLCRRFKGQILMRNIGIGSNKKTKHMLPSGIHKFLVYNATELEVLLMCTKSYCARITHNFPPKTEKPLLKEQHSWPSESPIPMPGCTVKRMNRWLPCVFYLCLNKPQKKN
ncbi:hypothetical protein STEG23_025760 [Scotinomys teguina]